MVFATLAVSDFLFGPQGASAAWLVPGHLALIAIAFTLLLVIARGGMDDLFAIPPRPAAPDLSIVDPKLVAGMTARIAGDCRRVSYVL